MIKSRQRFNQLDNTGCSCREVDQIPTSGWASKAGGRRLLLPLLALNLALWSDPAAAQEKEAIEDDQASQQVMIDNNSNQDLLLFWEEKELYVQTATRTAKPISQVAENMEVITAKDIEDMNAHSVNEVLNRVPGLFVDFQTNDFNSPAQLHIQGGSPRHVTVLLDGVVWNFLSDGHAETVTIPVGIVERIEIIKGPASSAWGSGMSGVVNVITKGVGDTTMPKGMVSATYGESSSRDMNAQLFGKAGPIKYFLHAGRLASDGLSNDRSSQSDSLYAKVAVSPSHNLDLLFTVGYSTPDMGQGSQHTPSGVGILDTIGKLELSAFHATAGMEYRPSPDFTVKADINTVRFRFAALTDFTSPNATLNVQTGDVFKSTVLKDKATSGSLKLTYTGGIHTAVLGAEAIHGENDQNIEVPWRSLASQVSSGVDKQAIFANDTLTLGSFAVTPGIRYDHNSISGEFISPSVGATYEFSEHSIARASVARGFTYPPFSMTSGGGAFWQANPGLSAERGWSYQAGVESAVMDRFNLKGTLFLHDISNAISDNPDPVQGKYVNVGKIVREGYEVSAESAPIYNTSAKLAYAYVHIDPDSPFSSRDNYSYQVAIKYDDRKFWLAQLLGTYIWWDLPGGTGDYNNFVWDAHLNRKFKLSAQTTLEAFFSVHNIFDAGYTTLLSQPNPGRWVEGGLKYRF